MAQSGQQLPLLVQLRDDATLDNFLTTDSSAALVAAVRSVSEGRGESVVFIHGNRGSGKSHLLQCIPGIGWHALLVAFPCHDELGAGQRGPG